MHGCIQGSIEMDAHEYLAPIDTRTSPRGFEDHSLLSQLFGVPIERVTKCRCGHVSVSTVSELGMQLPLLRSWTRIRGEALDKKTHSTTWFFRQMKQNFFSIEEL